MSAHVEMIDSPPKPVGLWISKLLLVGLIGLLLWSYHESLGRLGLAWKTPTYAWGWLVPAMAAIVLATRERTPQVAVPRERRSGLLLLAMGLIVRLYCADLGLELAQMLTFLPCLAGLVLMAGGWSTLRWCLPAIILLVFMFPLPWATENWLLDPLETLATRASIFLMQTFGSQTYSEGQVIYLSHTSKGMVDPCSRLRMLTFVAAAAVATIMIFRRPRWERWVIFLSVVPIALAANVVRITIGAIAFGRSNSTLVERMLSSDGAWVMAPVAVGLLAAESLFLTFLWRDNPHRISTRSTSSPRMGGAR